MLNVALGAFNVIRQGCLYLATFSGAYKVTQVVADKVEAERHRFQYNRGERSDNPQDEIQRCDDKIVEQFVKLLAFGYSSYRTVTGVETPFSFVVSCGATALMLYEPVKNSTQIAETVQAVQAQIFQPVEKMGPK